MTTKTRVCYTESTIKKGNEMKPQEENHQVNINEVPDNVWQEVEASRLPLDVLISELDNRGYTVEPKIIRYDEATGLMTDGTKYFDKDTGKEVASDEAYKRASGGW